jgi:hypothetical protein
MVLDYLQLPIRYEHLVHLLQAQEFGTFFSHVGHLKSLGLAVIVGDNAGLAAFEKYLELGLPVLVSVNTWTLLHWEGFQTQHALVVVGIDFVHETIYVHDPFFAKAPLELTFHQFEPAWTEMGRQFAVIGLTTIDQ